MAISIETVSPTPIVPTFHAITDLGAATLAVYRLKWALAKLSPTQRAEVLDLTAVELDIVHCPNGCRDHGA